MKHYSIITAAVLASAMTLFSGCGNNFLTVDNPTAEPIEEYFTTKEHLTEALVAAYDPLEWTDWAMGAYNPLPLMSDIMADQIWPGGSDRNDNHYWHLMAEYASTPNDCMTGLWTDVYSGVKRCNDVLKYIGWVEGLDHSTAVSYEAQARLLRVYYYSWLWKFWGNVPYYEENLDAPFVTQQFKADDVYEAMMKDLEGVIALNALPMKRSGSELGYMTKAFAYMLYAECAMYQKDASRLSTAFNYMKEIIDSHSYSLNPDYANIFSADGEWCDESIYEISYRSENSARSWGNPIYAGGTVLPRLLGPSGWSDGTPSNAPHDNGWGFCPVASTTVAMYEEGDTRRDATAWNAAAVGSYNIRYQDTGYFLEKYVGQTSNSGQIADGDLNYDKNIRVYRFAECLLNAAELAVSGYGSGDAEGWLNLVHNRAGLTDHVAATLDNIKQERRLEFVGEGKRYWDLIRWGDAASVLVAGDDPGFTTGGDRGKLASWKPSAKYLPIPQGEIDATAGTEFPLTQNEGY